METVKSLLVLVLACALGVGLFAGGRKLLRKQEVKGRFNEFRDALEVNDLRELYQFIPPTVQVMMPYETFEKELNDAKNSIRVREVTLDKVIEKKDPRRPRAEVTFTIAQEDIKSGKKTQLQLAYDWIKVNKQWYVSIKSIQQRYGRSMGGDDGGGRFSGVRE